MKTRKSLSILLALVMLLSLCACGGTTGAGSAAGTTASPNAGTTASGAPKTGAPAQANRDQLTVAVPVDPTDLNPHNRNLVQSHTIKKQMYETLSRINEKGELVPCLATSWETPDPKTLILKLRQGVKFHTGGELKASDVIFTLNLMQQSSYSKIGVDHVDFEKTVAVDDYTVKVALKDDFMAQINFFSWPLTAIVSEAGYKQINGDYSKASIGTGAYKLVSYVKDNEIKMTKNADYWEPEKPYITNITFRVIPEDKTRSLELQSGGVDVALSFAKNDVDSFQKDPNFKVLVTQGYQTNYLFFNLRNKFLQDYNVRKAICMAVDWEAVVAASYGAAGKYATTYMPEDVEGAVKFDGFGYDPEAAKELLAKSGYKDGDISLVFLTSNIEVRVKLVQMVQAFLAEVGIKMEAKVMEPAAFVNTYLTGEDFDLTYLGYRLATGEPGKVFLFSVSTDMYSNITNWKNPKFDDLINSAYTTLDKASRMAKYQEAQQLLHDELPQYPILTEGIIAGTKADVEGLVLDPAFECNEFKNVKFTK